MTTDHRPGGVAVDLGRWVSLHPASLAYAAGELTVAPADGRPRGRVPALAAALAAANERWGNPVAGELERWQHGAAAIVTGQQPGLLGGPLLTLIKTCAVAAEVRRRRAAGDDAVGFLWLATADDDLAEMGWARVAAGDEVIEAHEDGWARGGGVAGEALLGTACQALLGRLAEPAGSAHAREAERAGGELLRARHAARRGHRALPGAAAARHRRRHRRRPRARGRARRRRRRGARARAAAAGDRGAARRPAAVRGAHGWPLPFPVTPQRLPVFRLRGRPAAAHRQPRRRLPGRGARASSPPRPERFVPNVWLRSLVQDAALGSATVLLGGGELAYHLEAAELWPLAELPRPEWRLRPHVTVVTAGERRLARTLALAPAHLLDARMPRHLLGGKRVQRGVERLRRALGAPLDALDSAAATELPALAGDLGGDAPALLGAVGVAGAAGDGRRGARRRRSTPAGSGACGRSCGRSAGRRSGRCRCWRRCCVSGSTGPRSSPRRSTRPIRGCTCSTGRTADHGDRV